MIEKFSGPKTFARKHFLGALEEAVKNLNLAKAGKLKAIPIKDLLKAIWHSGNSDFPQTAKATFAGLRSRGAI